MANVHGQTRTTATRAGGATRPSSEKVRTFVKVSQKRKREPAPIQENPGNTEPVLKRMAKGRSGHRDARPLRGSKGAGAKKKWSGGAGLVHHIYIWRE